MCSWDEWVPESRVLKMTDASRQKQKEIQNAHMYVDVVIIMRYYLMMLHMVIFITTSTLIMIYLCLSVCILCVFVLYRRFVSEMTYYVSSGTLNLTKPKSVLYCIVVVLL